MDRYTIIITVAKIAEDGSEIETVDSYGTKYASSDQDFLVGVLSYYLRMIDETFTEHRHSGGNSTITCVLPEEEAEDLEAIEAMKKWEEIPW